MREELPATQTAKLQHAVKMVPCAYRRSSRFWPVWRCSIESQGGKALSLVGKQRQLPRPRRVRSHGNSANCAELPRLRPRGSLQRPGHDHDARIVGVRLDRETELAGEAQHRRVLPQHLAPNLADAAALAALDDLPPASWGRSTSPPAPSRQEEDDLAVDAFLGKGAPM